MNSNLYLAKIKNKILAGDFYKIAFIGDSITSTEWVHPNYREIVEYVLKEELTVNIGDWKIPSWKIRCFNCGFDGSTTRDLLELAHEGILVHKPTMAFLMIGDNDVHLNATSPIQYKENILKLIQTFKDNGVEEIFILIPPPANNNEINQKFIPYLNELKALFPNPNATLIDLWEDFEELNLNELYTFKSIGNDVIGMKPGELDFLHPNQLGNAYIAKFLLQKIFGIKFDPEKYIKTTLEGEMYPEY